MLSAFWFCFSPFFLRSPKAHQIDVDRTVKDTLVLLIIRSHPQSKAAFCSEKKSEMKNSWYALVALDTSSNNEKERRKKKRAGLIILLAYILFPPPPFVCDYAFQGRRKGPTHKRGEQKVWKTSDDTLMIITYYKWGKNRTSPPAYLSFPTLVSQVDSDDSPPVWGVSYFFPLHYQIQIRPMMAICGSLHSLPP